MFVRQKARRNPVETSPNNGFTLPEFMIAMSIGLAVLAAAASAYLFLSKNGRALTSQIAFSDEARVLQARFVELVESSSSINTDETQDGIVLQIGNNEAWIGFIDNDDPALAAIVYRPQGKDSAIRQHILCTHVCPAYSVEEESPKIFEALPGKTVLMNLHVGDSEYGSDTTGPGRQGVVVSIVASSRKLRREL